MDAEIGAAAKAYNVRNRGGKAESRDRPPAVTHGVCTGMPDGYCPRFDLFVTSHICTRCKSQDRIARLMTLQVLRAAALAGTANPPACNERSIALGVRGKDRAAAYAEETTVFVCRRTAHKVTGANCVLCRYVPEFVSPDDQGAGQCSAY